MSDFKWRNLRNITFHQWKCAFCAAAIVFVLVCVVLSAALSLFFQFIIGPYLGLAVILILSFGATGLLGQGISDKNLLKKPRVKKP